MFRVNNLTGFGAGSPPAVEVIQTDSASSTTNLSEYTFSLDIGAASPSRVVFVLVVGADNDTGGSISAVTVSGVSATEIDEATINGSGVTTVAAIYAAVVPTGSGAQNVVITTAPASNNFTSMFAQTVACLNVQSPVATFNGNATSATNAATVSNATCQAGGIILGAGGCEAFSQTASWSSLTESLDGTPGGSDLRYSTAYDALTSTRSATNETLTFTGSTDDVALVVASFR